MLTIQNIIEWVSVNGYNLQDVREQTPEICLAAVQQDGEALEFVREQTAEICLAAVQQNGYALRFVKEQTPEICLAAVKQNGYTLRFVREQTPELCLATVQHSCYALQYVREQTPELCLAAVKQNGYTLQFVREQTPEICLTAILQNQNALKYARIDLNIQELNPTSFEELPESVDLKDVIDPVTFEEPTPGTVCAFYVRNEQWIFLATLESCNCFIRSRVMNCTSFQITDPQRRIIVPVSEIRWVRI